MRRPLSSIREFLPEPTRLTLLAFLVIFAGVSQHYSGTARAQVPHVGANVVAWQTLKAAQHVPTTYKGAAQTVAKLQSGAATPLAMASADFDSDGVADLVIGYAHSGGGILAVHRGNLDAFAPQSHASWLATAHEQFPAPFLQQAAVIDLPEAPHFVVAGDFSGNGNVDILTGARGSEHLYLLTGLGKGKFSTPQTINMPGKLTALAAGQVGMRDRKTDVVAGIQSAKAAAVVVYKGSAGGLSKAQAVSYAVPEAATQLEIADLHGDGFSDVAVLAGSDVLIIHPTAPAGADTTPLVERVPVGGVARSIALGGFVWDRHSRNQLAVLSQSGTVQILSSGELDTRPFTAEERFARRSATLRRKLPSELKAPWSGQSEPWSVVKTSSVSAPLTGNVRLVAVSMAHARPQDLMVVDSSDSRLHVLPANTSGDSANDAGELTVETGDKPAAVLPMRVNVDGRPGLVMVGKSVSHPKAMAPLPDPTFFVNRLDDPAASAVLTDIALTCNNISATDTSSSCSFRQAVIKANTTPGSDTIMLPVGAITLTQFGLEENNAVTGDVDVRDTLSIVGSVDGSGSPASSITGGAGWNDKFISTNKDGTTSGSLSISNVNFANGNNTNASGGSTFDYLGGAVDFFGCAAEGGGCTDPITGLPLPVSSLSVTNVQFGFNTAAGCGAGNDCGGGLDSEFGPTTISGTYFGFNTASFGRGGALTLVGAAETMSVTGGNFVANQSAQEGGALYIDFENTGGTGSISVHSSTFINNTAGADGGGVYVNLGSGGNTTTAAIDQGTVIGGAGPGNTSATRGGGLAFNGITGTVATPGTTSLSISKVTITGNHANGSSDDGGGAILVASGGTLNLQYSRIVGNTTSASGKPTGMTVESGTGGSASTVNAAENWWGCNTGPSVSPCDTVAIVNGSGATLTDAPWIVLTLAASPTSVEAVAPNNTSSLTADFLHDSAGGAVSASSIDVLLSLPITFGATAGSISGAQAAIQAGNVTIGTATATFTHDANCNASSAKATVDTNPPPTVTTPITILCPDLTAGKSNSLGVSGVTTPLSSPTWTWTTDVLNTGAATAPATFTNGETIFTDTLPSGNVSYSNLSFNPVTNMSCSVVANLLTCSASGGDVTLGVSQGFFVGVTATATAAGSYVNPSSSGTCAVDPSNHVIEFNENNNSCSNTVTVVAPPTISKAFGTTSIPVGGTTTLTFTVTNPSANTVAESGVAFSDTLTGGLQVGATPNLVNGCGGTFTGATSGSTSLSLSGGSIATNTSCTISLNVTGTTAGIVSNTTGAVSSTNGGTGATSNTATINVANPPIISKAFGSATIPLNGTTSLTFSINNPNSGLGLTGVAFTDTLPAGLVVSTPNGASNTCNGAPSYTAGSSSVSLTGGTLASSGTCSIIVNVTGTTAGTKSNTTGAISSTETGAGATSNTASLTVVVPPTISKAFNPTSVAVNGSSTLSFNITNPNTASALSGVAFIDTLPAGVAVAATPNVTGTCGSGTITAVAGSGAISLSGGTLTASPAAGSSCTFSADVTGTTAGTKSNTTSAVTSTEGGTGAPSNTATLNVLNAPSIAKAFGAANIPLNSTTTLTLTISNSNGTALNGVAVSDTFPSGLQVAGVPGASNTCGGTFAPAAGNTTVSLAGGTVSASGSCAVSVNVTAASSGTKTNTTGNVSSTNGGTGNTGTASLTVATPPTISKAFGAATIPLNGSTSLTFSISNPNSGLGLTGVAFTDNLPAGLVVSNPNGASNTCNGTPSYTTGSSSVSLSGGTLASSGTCSLNVNVTGTTAGTKSNTTGAISSTETGAGATSNTASLTVVGPPSISKAFGAASIPLNSSTSVTLTITNPNTGTALSGVAFSDNLPAGLVVATPTGASNTCGGTLTATAAGSSISLSGGGIALNSSCSVSANVTGTTAGTKSNTTGAVSSTEGGTGSSSNTVTLAVVAPPSISKAFSPTSTSVGGTSTLTLTIANPNTGTALSGVAVTDNFPNGLQVAAVPGAGNTCGGTFAPAAGATTISLSGGTIAASGSCAVSVNVTPTTSGSKLNTTGNVSSTNGGTGNSASATLGAGDFTISVVPTTQTIPPGHMAVYTQTLSSNTGFQGTINLTCSGGPPNSTCTVIPSSVTLVSSDETAKVTVDLAVPKGASKGTSTLTFTGTSGTLTHSTTAKLTVK